MTGWWLTFYDDIIADALFERDPIILKQNVEFIVRQGALKEGARVLDQCCGQGGLSLVLAQHGYDVTGIDLSAGYIARAQAEAARQNLSCHLACQDADIYQTDAPFDVVFNWHTGFAYHADDDVNIRKIENAYKNLKPGGLFMLDFSFPAAIFKNFAAERRYKVERSEATYEIYRKSHIDFAQGAMITDWTVKTTEALSQVPTKHMQSLTRLYAPHELQRFATKAGFETTDFYSNTKSEPLTIDSQRCIAVMRKAL